MTNRKKPGVAFWATLAAVVVGLYLLSWGPALFVWTAVGQPDWLESVVDVVYFPIDFIGEKMPDPVELWMVDYGNWWIDKAPKLIH